MDLGGFEGVIVYYASPYLQFHVILFGMGNSERDTAGRLSARLGKPVLANAVVVDVANVCTASREIAIENSMEERITYHPANFLNDELPTGFDMVLECDVGVQSEELFRKLRSTLNPGGRLVIVDLFAPEPGLAPASRLGWALRDSLADEKYMIPTSADIQTQLTQAGFQPLSEDIISGGWIMIVARK